MKLRSLKNQLKALCKACGITSRVEDIMDYARECGERMRNARSERLRQKWRKRQQLAYQALSVRQRLSAVAAA